jgi:hypothetical protein
MPETHIIYISKIERADVKRNRNTIFIFGDNDQGKGYGGLARETRGEPNAYGIRVKKKPTMEYDAFYTDEEYNENLRKITTDINNIIDVVNEKGDCVIMFPSKGIGTGLASMSSKCPRTFKAMNLVLEGTLGIKNGE